MSESPARESTSTASRRRSRQGNNWRPNSSGTPNPLQHAPALAYVTALGQRLAAGIDGPPFTYTFALIADDPAALHEPMAVPGGILYVPAPLILAAKDEDELAGMLAHAIAHVASRDGARLATREQLMSIMTQPMMAIEGLGADAVRRAAKLGIRSSSRRWRRSGTHGHPRTR